MENVTYLEIDVPRDYTLRRTIRLVANSLHTARVKLEKRLTKSELELGFRGVSRLIKAHPRKYIYELRVGKIEGLARK